MSYCILYWGPSIVSRAFEGVSRTLQRRDGLDHDHVVVQPGLRQGGPRAHDPRLPAGDELRRASFPPGRSRGREPGDYADIGVFFPGEPEAGEGGAEEPEAEVAEEPEVVVPLTMTVAATEQAVDVDVPRTE